MTEVIVKTPEAKPVAKMIVPGRRALGEAWQEVTIAVKDDRIQVTENRPVEAPPGGRAVVVPGMAALSTDAVNYILEGALQRQEYAKRRPRRRPVTDKEIEQIVNQMWLDFCEQKVRAFSGTSQFGPKGKTQREGFGGDRNFSGVKPR